MWCLHSGTKNSSVLDNTDTDLYESNLPNSKFTVDYLVQLTAHITLKTAEQYFHEWGLELLQIHTIP
jgi:hypothetical protein